MSIQTEICRFCGGEIIFRIIKGVVTPLHVGEANCVGKGLYRRDREGIPFHTSCPKCSKGVIFLRNNGGSVWLDDLGWPWPKHACFSDDTAKCWSKVIPQPAIALKKPLFLFAAALGKLRSKKGVVLFFGIDKMSLRRNPKYHQDWQYVIEDAEYRLDELLTLFNKIPVIVSFGECRLVTLQGAEYQIKEHGPVYLGWRDNSN